MNHSERADESTQTSRDNASQRERERERFPRGSGQKERKKLYEKQIREWGKKRNELKMTVNHL